jgi:uncharacterized protein (TIGR02246 family)
MRAYLFWLMAVTALLLPHAHQSGWAGKGDDSSADNAAIAKNAEAFIEAFHKGDAKALAASWTADGDYVDQAGQHLKGREAIETAFQGFFAENKDLKLRIDSQALRFVTPELAIEDGTSEVIPPDGGPPSRARYTNVHAKKDGRWLLSSVREAPYAPPTNYEHLRGLEWAVGNWVGWADEAEKGEADRISFAWAENQQFIVATASTAFKNITLGSATQWIGWDPEAKRLRSWSFDSTGVFGQGTWAKDGAKWVIKSTSVLRDGKKAMATTIVTRIDADTLSWQSMDRTLDGKPQPATKEVRMKRVR